jgi:DNA-directed RNA polymerase subunit RPC12/RpoP
MEGDEAAAAAAAARIRVVRCPRCDKFLPELPAYSVYVCGGCGATLQGTRHGGCLLHSVFRRTAFPCLLVHGPKASGKCRIFGAVLFPVCSSIAFLILLHVLLEYSFFFASH